MAGADVAEIYRDDTGEFRYHIKAGNGEIIAQGEGYKHRQDIYTLLADHFPHTTIVDLTERS